MESFKNASVGFAMSICLSALRIPVLEIRWPDVHEILCWEVKLKCL
jgi:hypothetical protein